jgi:hypothetical protein
MASSAIPAVADEVLWPELAPGGVKTIDDSSKVSSLALAAAGIGATPVRRDIQFTFFKAPHGHDFVIIKPCCDDTRSNATLFQLDKGVVKPVELIVGDPRSGFAAQAQADSIKVDDGALALRARVAFATCEIGVWGYYYRFDDSDQLRLLSVIDTGCSHLGVREFYHAKDVDVGHWWMQ